MRELNVLVTNSLGLHARAAAQLVRLAGRFSSKIIIHRVDNGVEANAKSILSVLHIAAGLGVELKLRADGPDENVAVEEIGKLFAGKFGEDR